MRDQGPALVHVGVVARCALAGVALALAVPCAAGGGDGVAMWSQPAPGGKYGGPHFTSMDSCGVPEPKLADQFTGSGESVVGVRWWATLPKHYDGAFIEFWSAGASCPETLLRREVVTEFQEVPFPEVGLVEFTAELSSPFDTQDGVRYYISIGGHICHPEHPPEGHLHVYFWAHAPGDGAPHCGIAPQHEFEDWTPHPEFPTAEPEMAFVLYTVLPTPTKTARWSTVKTRFKP